MTTENSTTNATILLVDNGSTRADAALQLRAIAQKLSKQSNHKIHAVSLKHSNRIAVDDVKNKLDGIPARVFKEFIKEQLNVGQREFILIPLFFGKSRALTSFIPDEKAVLESTFGPFNLNMTEVLYPLPDGDKELVEILFEHALATIKNSINDPSNNLVLVDHGSPIATVNAVRQHIAAALNKKLPDGVSIAQAAMERRDGKEYDFNGELLEDHLLQLAQSGETHATVVLQFLLPGTHAGDNGDIVQICNSVMEKYTNFTVSISPLIGQNEKLITCLSERLQTLISAKK